MTSLLLAATLLQAQTSGSFYDFKPLDIDGKPLALGKFKGKVALVVNVASLCGNTPQYEGLEKLYKAKKKAGFAVLGFPANEFGAQEPGTNKDIKTFCAGKYHVTFPMFSKIVVKGEGQDPLYKWLIAQSDRPSDAIEWNFAKFLIDRHGKVIARFKPNETVESPSVIAKIDAALAAK